MIALVLPAATAMAAPVTDVAPVRDVEHALADARIRGDAPAVTDLLADEYLGVDRFGQLHTRETVLSGGFMSVCEAVHLHGMVAVVVAHEGDLRVLRVWIARDMRWQLVAEQDVMIQPGRSDPDATWSAADVGDAPQFERASTIRDVLRAQDALDRANAMRDPATFARLTDPDFVVVTSAGLVRSKADRVVEERIASLERQPERPAPKRDNVQVRLFGSTVAIVTARNWPRTFEGTPRPRTRYTRVWVKTVSGWQQAANISTVIVPMAP
jgi:hypothetical protein